MKNFVNLYTFGKNAAYFITAFAVSAFSTGGTTFETSVAASKIEYIALEVKELKEKIIYISFLKIEIKNLLCRSTIHFELCYFFFDLCHESDHHRPRQPMDQILHVRHGI